MLAFAVEVEMKMVRTAIVRPYMYKGGYCPKEGKNRRKVNVFFDWCVECYF